MAEKEYIERGALIEMLNQKAKTDHEMGLYTHGALTESFIRFVERQPAADVVEVVRCKDCKMFHKCIDGTCLCCKSSGLVGNITGDSFCSYGERRRKS